MQSKQFIASFKGTAGEYLKLGDLAPTIISAPTKKRGFISPYVMKACDVCEGEGRIAVANGPDDFDWEICAACDGTGQILAANR
jgi:hypothetical protein